MTRNGIHLAVLLSIIATSVVIPAYAEVTSLKTSSSFYKGGSIIEFSGTTLSTDPPNVTILIFDPAGNFKLLASGITNASHAFHVSVDTSLQSNQKLFTLKGMYNATAFIANQTSGKKVSFAFSPDGSSLITSPPTNLTATSPSPTEIDLRWLAPQNNGGLPITGYKIERNDGSGFNPIANSPLTNYPDKGLGPYTEHAYRVSAITSAGSSAPSNSAHLFTQQSPTTPPPSTTQNPSPPTGQTGQSLSDILQQRYETARKLQEMLNAKSGPSSTTPSPSSNPPQTSPKTIQLNENVGAVDMSPKLESKKSGGISDNNLNLNNFANFDIKTILYPVISLVGIGLVVTILYFRKKRKPGTAVKQLQDAHLPVEQIFERKEDDYALAILKNRLAKGEITVDEFKKLKDELLEP